MLHASACSMHVGYVCLLDACLQAVIMQVCMQARCMLVVLRSCVMSPLCMSTESVVDLDACLMIVVSTASMTLK